MKIVPLAAASITLLGCAVAPDGLQTAQEVGPADTTSTEPHSLEDIEVAAVVELEPRSGDASEEELCRRTPVTGTRISRVQCQVDVPETQRVLNEAIVRSEIEYAREMAMIEEQRQAEQAAEAAIRQMQSGMGR